MIMETKTLKVRSCVSTIKIIAGSVFFRIVEYVRYAHYVNCSNKILLILMELRCILVFNKGCVTTTLNKVQVLFVVRVKPGYLVQLFLSHYTHGESHQV